MFLDQLFLRYRSKQGLKTDSHTKGQMDGQTHTQTHMSTGTLFEFRESNNHNNTSLVLTIGSRCSKESPISVPIAMAMNVIITASRGRPFIQGIRAPPSRDPKLITRMANVP